MKANKEIRIKSKYFYLILIGISFITISIDYLRTRHYYDKRYEIFGVITQPNSSEVGTFIKINNIDFDFWGLSKRQKQNIQKGDSIYKPMGEKYFILFSKDANGVFQAKDTISFW